MNEIPSLLLFFIPSFLLVFEFTVLLKLQVIAIFIPIWNAFPPSFSQLSISVSNHHLFCTSEILLPWKSSWDILCALMSLSCSFSFNPFLGTYSQFHSILQKYFICINFASYTSVRARTEFYFSLFFHNAYSVQTMNQTLY